MSVDNLKKKKTNNKEDSTQGRDCVRVQMSMSMQCTICHMLKLKELTEFVDSGKKTWATGIVVA